MGFCYKCDKYISNLVVAFGHGICGDCYNCINCKKQLPFHELYKSSCRKCIILVKLEFCKLTEIGCNLRKDGWNHQKMEPTKNKREIPPAFKSKNLWEPHLASIIFSYVSN